MGSILTVLGGTLGVIFFLLIGFVQIVLGFLGIDYHFGSGWAVAALIGSLVFRITFPLTIGTFFGALDVLGWNWFGAILITVPGLIFMVPGAVGIALAGLADKFANKPSTNFQTSVSDPINVTPPKKKKVKKRKKSKKK